MFSVVVVFMPSPYFISSPQCVVRSPCFILTGDFRDKTLLPEVFITTHKPQR